jgi:hypothetical protein
MLDLTACRIGQLASKIGFYVFRIQNGKLRGLCLLHLRLDAFPEAGSDTAEGGSYPRLALPEKPSHLARGLRELVFVLEEFSLLLGQSVETFFKMRNDRGLG